MKFDRSHLFIFVSSFALVIVLIIQVNWILETAKAKEAIFNEKAKIVLSRTTEALCADKQACKNLETSVGNNEKRKIDSLFRYFMDLYKVEIKYYYEVKPGTLFASNNTPPSKNINTNQTGCYQACIGDASSQNASQLKLVFPEAEEYILAEMGIPFISSVILILIVLVMSWRTTLSLLKEKLISEHTTDFLNNMTHEFKTPLTNISLAGKMILKDTNLKQEEKIKHYSGIILEENEKLRLQVEHVLSMTALERGEIPLYKTELDLHQLIKDSLKSMSVQVESKQGNVHMDLNAKPHIILADKTHFTNAICNLIDNAIKYSVDKPEISIETSNGMESLILCISDKGIGIDEKYKEHIFDKFYRVPTGDVHNVKGFGLGLAYVKTIIEMHGGKIEVCTEKGNGSIFKITLPHA
jgi:two-component system phosphate regulon sensor histidine kinase PhoR